MDHRRCYRALIAWCDGDRLALDAVLEEVMADPTGVPGLLFDVLAFAVDLGERVAPDFRDQLRNGLLALVQDGP
jgi:hypothetical protein